MTNASEAIPFCNGCGKCSDCLDYAKTFTRPEPRSGGEEQHEWQNTAGDYELSVLMPFIVFGAGLVIGWFLKGL